MKFNIPDLIKKKRDGKKLTAEEIQFFIDSVVDGSMQEVQIGAMLMAIFLQSMDIDETVQLTHNIATSGSVFTWPEEWRHLVVDKHSTGGVGDKVSLPLVPALMACGLKVPMISGRGLGITGGTLDKLESIPGFRVEMKESEIEALVSTVGGCIVGQTKSLVPADRKLYAYRDVTGTIENMALTTASIISKKLAEGVSALVLDVKYGSGAFFQIKEDAWNLAQSMVSLGRKSGMTVSAVLSSMDHPLGFAIGNALEVAEALECLQGKVITDLNEAVEELGAELLYLTGISSKEGGKKKIASSLKNGSALQKFQDIIIQQGVEEGDAKELCRKGSDVFQILPKAPHMTHLQSPTSGYVQSIDALILGKVAQELGAGRHKTGQAIDYAVGLKLLVQIGFPINKGEDWIIVHHSKETLPVEYQKRLQSALVISPKRILISSRITDLIRPSNLNNNI